MSSLGTSRQLTTTARITTIPISGVACTVGHSKQTSMLHSGRSTCQFLTNYWKPAILCTNLKHNKIFDLKLQQTHNRLLTSTE